MMTKKSSQANLPLVWPPLVLVLAWLVPGLGHMVLGRRLRGLAFTALVLGAFVFGCWLGGAMIWEFSGSPLRRLATLGVMGSGLAPFVARMGFGYAPDPTGAGFEYGGAFILTAGLMNVLLLLDAWDITWGKELLEDEEQADPDSETPAAATGEGKDS